MLDAQPEEETSPTPVIPEEAPTRDPETGALLAPAEETPVVDPPAPAEEETATVQTDSTPAASTDVSETPPAEVSTENILGTDAITNLVQISASLRSWVNALDAGIQVLQQESAK